MNEIVCETCYIIRSNIKDSMQIICFCGGHGELLKNMIEITITRKLTRIISSTRKAAKAAPNAKLRNFGWSRQNIK